MVGAACLLQVKAFGDLVIAAAAAARVVEADRSRLTLAIGGHLRPLCDAIVPSVAVVDIDTQEPGVPSLFDARRNGLMAATRSGWRMRSAIRRVFPDRRTLLLWDHLGVRERLVSAGRPACSMPDGTDNVYVGYDRLLVANGFRLAPVEGEQPRRRRLAGIFPGSRIAAKNLPVALVAELLAVAEREGLPTTLFLLDGERPDLEASGLPHVLLPRRFAALRAALQSTDVAVSADSLPAHWAESLGIDVFVLTPRANEFWMPRSVFVERRWCLFDDPDRLDRVRGMLIPRV